MLEKFTESNWSILLLPVFAFGLFAFTFLVGGFFVFVLGLIEAAIHGSLTGEGGGWALIILIGLYGAWRVITHVLATDD